MNRLLPTLAAAIILTASPAFAGVSQAKLASVGSATAMDGVVTQIDVGECYIESQDRAAGIWVLGATEGLHVGDVVSASGVRDIIDGEACITGAAITPQGRQSTVAPFSLINRAVGGSNGIYDYLGGGIGWVPTGGASNTGLLIKTWGTVRSCYYSPITGSQWFYIDDGSGAVSDLGDEGVLVYSEAPVERRDFVTVTGVSSLEPSLDDPDRAVRVVRTSGSSAVVIAKPAPLKSSFTDEFNSAHVDYRWFLWGGDGSMSLSSQPGWLELTVAPPGYNVTRYSPELLQPLDGDCDIEMRVRLNFPTQGKATNRFRVVLADTQSKVTNQPWLDSACDDIARVEHFYAGGVYYDQAILGHSYAAVELASNTLYLRLHCRRGDHGTTVDSAVSFDGVNYLGAGTTTGSGSGIAFFASSIDTYSGDLQLPFSACIDYFRLTKAAP